MLWFDVLWRFSTLQAARRADAVWLWFDVLWRFSTLYERKTGQGGAVVIWCSLEIQYTPQAAYHTSTAVVIWCSLEIQYTSPPCWPAPRRVVIWCSLEIQYTTNDYYVLVAKLWFDVLWRFSTLRQDQGGHWQGFWFDVLWRFSTLRSPPTARRSSCDLMFFGDSVHYWVAAWWDSGVVIWCSLEIQYTLDTII